MTVPSVYDSGKGWQQTVNWVPQKVKTLPFTEAPKAGVVAYMTAAENGYTVQARDAASGAVRWTSAPWNPPIAMGEDGTGQSSDSVEIPDLVRVTQGGVEYVVAWAHGMEGKDELHKGKEVVQVDVYAATAKGGRVEPVRSVSVPVQDAGNQLQVRDGGDGLLITWGGGITATTYGASVDMSTGHVTQYGDADKLLSQCADMLCYGGDIVAATGKGPVVDVGGTFALAGGWLSGDVVVDGVEARTRNNSWAYPVLLAPGGNLIAGLPDPSDSDPHGHIWSVLDAETGRVRVSLSCSVDRLTPGGDSSAPYNVVTSPDGRYVVVGPLAFDLQRGTGRCFAGDGDTKGLLLASVSDDGTAYGFTDEDDVDTPAAAVSVSLTTGTTTALPTGTQIPIYVLPTVGVFVTREDDGDILISGRRSR